MNKRTLVALLALSIAFNLAFAFGFFYAQQQLQRLATPEGRWQVISDELQLSKKQQQQVQVIWQRGRERLLPLQRRHSDDLKAFWTEMMADKPDARRIRKILKRTAKATNEAREIRVELMFELMLVLTPEQRLRYQAIVQRLNPALKPHD